MSTTAMSEHIVEFAGTITEYNGVPILQDGALREEIVRCRDCQHYKETDCLRRFNMAFCKFHSGPCEPRGYCAWGERKE